MANIQQPFEDRVKEAFTKAALYLLAACHRGKWFEFDGLKYGPSGPWVTACVASALLVLGVRPPAATLKYILTKQRRNGGWAYNWKVPADADTTLRILQFLRLYGYHDEKLVRRAEKFVLLHQRPDGGLATYRDLWGIKFVARVLGSKNANGWTDSQGCVSALAINVLCKPPASLLSYMDRYLKQYGTESYWWRSYLYIANEIDRAGIGSELELPLVKTNSAIDISLRLLMDARHANINEEFVWQLVEMQLPDGSFKSKGQMRIPRPHQGMDAVVPIEQPGVRIAEEERSLFSTAAAMVALHEQWDLLRSKTYISTGGQAPYIVRACPYPIRVHYFK